MILQVGQKKFDPWETWQIHRSLFEMTGSFAAGTGNLNLHNPSEWNIDSKSEIKVTLNNIDLITGYIDYIDLFIGQNNASLDIKGRDKTADLVDCTFENSENEFVGLTVPQVIEKLADSISVDNIAGVSNTLDTFKANEGEFIIQMINRLARDHGFLAIPSGDGKLSLVKAGNKTAHDNISADENGSERRMIYNNYERYSNYFVKGYGIGNDNKSTDDYITPNGSESDSNIRTRNLTIFTDNAASNDSCDTRAKFEARIRAGLSRTYQYTLQGFKQTNGQIWELNSKVQVKDNLFKLNKEMIIYEIDYLREKESDTISETTIVKLCHPETFDTSSTLGNIKGGIFE